MKLARTDGQVFLFLNAKCKRLFNNRKKPSKLAWTAIYRKAHKKVSVRTRQPRSNCGRVLRRPAFPAQDVSTEAARKKRKATKAALTRSIVGVSLEART